jgi:hypothetical protein
MSGEGKEGRVWRPGERFGRRDARGRLVLDEPSAAYLNALVAELRRRSPLVGVPPVDVAEGSDGRSISVALPRKIYGKLSGAGTGGQYSFVEQEWTGSAWSDGGGGESGTDNAWESNHLAGLAGKVVLLRWEETSADWRFHYGSYGGCEADLCVTVTACGAYLAGATVTVKETDDVTVVGTCTTDATGRCCVASVPVGSYKVTASKTGYTSVTVDASVVPCTGTAGPIVLAPTGIKQICFKVYGCQAIRRPSDHEWPTGAEDLAITGISNSGAFVVPGATVNLKQSGVTIVSGTTDAAGHVCLTPPALGNYDVEIIKTGYVYYVPGPHWAFPLGPFTPNNRGVVGADTCFDWTYRAFLEVDPVGDFYCCGILIDKTGTFTMSNGCGSVDLTWSAELGWSGCQSVPATQPVCDAYHNFSEASGNCDISWRMWCVYNQYGWTINIRAEFLQECCIKSINPSTGVVTEIKRYDLASECPLNPFHSYLYGPHTCQPGRCGGPYWVQVGCSYTADEPPDPFTASCMLPDIIRAGFPGFPGIQDSTCGDGNIWPTPDQRFPCPGMVTVS